MISIVTIALKNEFVFFLFFNFLKQRQEIQKVIMILLHYIKYK
jgi:hypothetical protein